MNLKDVMISCTPVGSAVTCNPPVLNTDRDFLILVSSKELKGFCATLEKAGWVTSSKDYGEVADFRSYKKGNINYIVTDNTDFHIKFLFANKLATQFNLLRKVDRVTLFKAILYGVSDV